MKMTFPSDIKLSEITFKQKVQIAAQVCAELANAAFAAEDGVSQEILEKATDVLDRQLNV